MPTPNQQTKLPATHIENKNNSCLIEDVMEQPTVSTPQEQKLKQPAQNLKTILPAIQIENMKVTITPSMTESIRINMC